MSTSAVTTPNTVVITEGGGAIASSTGNGNTIGNGLSANTVIIPVASLITVCIIAICLTVLAIVAYKWRYVTINRTITEICYYK